MADRRELYRSPNGDTWFLGREPTSGHAFIVHQPNALLGVNCPTLSWASSCAVGMGRNNKHCCA